MVAFSCYRKICALMVAPFRDSRMSVSLDCCGMQRNRIRNRMQPLHHLQSKLVERFRTSTLHVSNDLSA